MTKQQILEEARKLPPAERADLAVDLWTIVEEDGSDLSPEMRAELDRRIAEDDADESPGEPWQVLREKVLRGEY